MASPQKRPPASVAEDDHQSRVLPPEAQRALAEAEERRKARDTAAETARKEVNGPKGPEPTRYGDWEKKGIVSDF
jgi:hypothetical protein